MKIAELSQIDQKQIDEAPAGMLGQFAKRAGAAVLGKVPGMGNVAANLTGKADVGKTANDVYKKFSQYLGTQQKNIKTATGDDLSNFLQNTYNYNQAKVPQGVLNKQQAYDVIMQMAKDGYAQMGKGGGGSAPAAQGQQGGAPAQGSQAAGGAAAKPAAKAGATQAAAGASAKPEAIPANIQKQLDLLTPTEKKALAGMLQ